MRKLLLLALLLAPSGLVGAPKPVGTSTPAVAVIGYKQNGTRDIVLANEDGTGASAIYTSRERGVVVRSGPLSSRTFLMIEGTKLSLLKYRATSTGVALDSVTALPISGNAGDISPDGTLIAYADGQSFRTYRLSDGASGLITTLPTGAYLGLITFTRDGSAVVYSVHNGGTAVSNLYRAALSGGDAVDLQISGVITELATAPDGSIFTSRQPDSSLNFVIEQWPADGGSATYVTNGNRPTLSCSGTQLMFQTSASSAAAIGVLRRDLTTGLQYTFAKSGYYAPEYLGC